MKNVLYVHEWKHFKSFMLLNMKMSDPVMKVTQYQRINEMDQTPKFVTKKQKKSKKKKSSH